ncbi:family 43 glycosylhydrolase, partial [Rosenbergiella collisarenosi]|uniref:family 43 glycosylhydrolase n=2 Tax=Rosenbergiella collisarenosi TaxID=1544695 RepID=UPI001F4E6055
YKNIYYMVGQHIPEKNAEGKSRYYGITIVKSKDMIHWTDINFLAKANLESGDLSSGSTIERPKLLVDEKNNNFYIWFHLEKRGMGYNSALVGVLKSKYIDKNYNYIGSFKINKRKLPFGEYDLSKLKNKRYFLEKFDLGQDSRDMNIYQDKSGKWYLVSSSENNTSIIISEINSNHDGLTGKYTRLFPGLGNEAPIMFEKNNDIFLYTSDVTGWKPNKSRLYTARSIFGPWRRIDNFVKSDIKNINSTFGSQGSSIIEFRGKEYYIGDVWNTNDLSDSGYLVKPINWSNGLPFIE